MKFAALLLSAAVLAACPQPVLAQEDAASPEVRQAAHLDTFLSHDADDTSLIRAGLSFDLRHYSPDEYRGLRLEKAWFNPLGQGWQSQERAYIRFGERFGDWSTKARVGTDGDTILGSVTVHNDAPLRQEYFVEREIVETPQGLARGIYYTFAGAALDIPADERNSFTVLAGVQEFTGDNVRLHLRANYAHVLDEEQGLSVQLRTRYFRNSEPREYDYYSPRWYAQALPVLQLRRYSGGWRYLVAGGIGVQKEADDGWRRSSYFNAQVESPRQGDWAFNAAILFSETPSAVGQSYRYTQGTLGVTRIF